MSSATLLREVVEALLSNPANLFESFSLGILGEALGADRAYLVAVENRDGFTGMKIRNRWIQQEKLSSFDYDVKYFSETMEAGGALGWKRKLEDGHVVVISIEESSPSIRRILESRAAHSVVLVPVRVESDWWGFLEFVDCTSLPKWNGRLQAFLQSVAGVFAMALQNEALREFIERREIQALETQVATNTASQRIDALRRWRDTLTSSFAHDFRTPLYTLLGFSATLLENQDLDDDPEIRRMCLRHIHEQARRLEGLVKNILTAASVSGENSPETPVRIDLVSLTSTLAEELRERADFELVDIYYQAPDSPVELVCFPEMMRRLLSLLLDFTLLRVFTGGWVSFTLTAGDDAVEIVVSDNGPGLPQDVIDHIFDVAPSDLPAAGVHGGIPGLSIAKEIVDSHHGFITVESKEGDGCIFRCSFPRDAAGE